MSDNIPGYQRLFAELKRRHVFRVMAVYGVVAFGIIEAADAVFPRVALPDWTVTFVVWLALLGFPVAIVLAWALETTPDGVRRTAEAAPGELTEIISAPASKRWPAGVLALVGMTALLAGVWFVGRQSALESVSDADPAAGPVSESIAVLPFADMSPDGDQEYFSDGISEELLNLLTRIPELRVAARTSSFSFKGENLEIPEIADRLNVAHVLEGSVRKDGDEVRITAQLIRADDGFHVWSESWDRTLDDIFAIQDEIAAEVAEQLKITLLGAAPRAEATDPEAYALFLQARQLFRQGTAESLDQSVALYERALEIEPDYAASWAGLANSYITQAASTGQRSVEEGFGLAREAATRALEIDPENAEAYARLGRIAMLYDGDLAAAARYLERALALDPTNTDIIGRAAVLAADLGRLDEAIGLAEYVIARDPVNPTNHYWKGRTYLWAGRLDEAIASLRTALSLSPGRFAAQYFIGTALLAKGEPDAALAAMHREANEGWRLLGLAKAYHALGQETESDAALLELNNEENEPGGWAYNIAYVYAFRGEPDRALEWLDKAVQYNDAGLSLIAVDVRFANLYEDPRWLPFLESIGKSPEQLAAIEFEVALPQ
jgi:TolB-like protein/Flp pilus assembly protein TadD